MGTRYFPPFRPTFRAPDPEPPRRQWDPELASPLDDLLGHAITYRIAVGPQRGQKAFTLQTLPPTLLEESETDNLARAGGFSLHAGIAAQARAAWNAERAAGLGEAITLGSRGRCCFRASPRWRSSATPQAGDLLALVA